MEQIVLLAGRQMAVLASRVLESAVLREYQSALC